MISGRTGVLGVIGDPVEHTASPAMHNAALAATGLDYAYVAFHVVPERLVDVSKAMRALEIRGLNVTVPHKVTVMEGLDEISEEARSIGAVNTNCQRPGTPDGSQHRRLRRHGQPGARRRTGEATRRDRIAGRRRRGACYSVRASPAHRSADGESVEPHRIPGRAARGRHGSLGQAGAGGGAGSMRQGEGRRPCSSIPRPWG